MWYSFSQRLETGPLRRSAAADVQRQFPRTMDYFHSEARRQVPSPFCRKRKLKGTRNLHEIARQSCSSGLRPGTCHHSQHPLFTRPGEVGLSPQVLIFHKPLCSVFHRLASKGCRDPCQLPVPWGWELLVDSSPIFWPFGTCDHLSISLSFLERQWGQRAGEESGFLKPQIVKGQKV